MAPGQPEDHALTHSNTAVSAWINPRFVNKHALHAGFYFRGPILRFIYHMLNLFVKYKLHGYGAARNQKTGQL